jgi:hypothetical protein
MCAGHWGKYFGCFHHQLIVKFIGSQWAEPLVVFVRRKFCNFSFDFIQINLFKFPFQ